MAKKITPRYHKLLKLEFILASKVFLLSFISFKEEEEGGVWI
jgi:hypothetical protein